jgi:hypothetical protein
MKNSFYFLHIQKTAGRNFRYNFLDPIKPDLLESGISWLNNEKNGHGHNQWLREIDDLTYITSSFRDPCKQMVSLYVHQEISKLNDCITKEGLLKWFKDENGEVGFISNFQSKNIVSPTVYFKENNITFYNKNITKNEVLNNIYKMSLFIKPEILIEKNQTIIQNTILSGLNIKKQKINNPEWIQSPWGHENSQSKEIYNSLTKKEKEYIKTLNPIDSEIYDTESLFYKI